MNANSITMTQVQDDIYKLSFGGLNLTLRRLFDTQVPYEGRFFTFTRPDLDHTKQQVPISVFKELNDGTIRKATQQEIKKLRRVIKKLPQEVSA